MRQRLQRAGAWALEYWKSRQSNIHGLIALLAGGSGFATLEALGIHGALAKWLCAVAVVVGALLETPSPQ